eukprot:265609-Rhodomonas_salina.1
MCTTICSCQVPKIEPGHGWEHGLSADFNLARHGGNGNALDMHISTRKLLSASPLRSTFWMREEAGLALRRRDNEFGNIPRINYPNATRCPTLTKKLPPPGEEECCDCERNR